MSNEDKELFFLIIMDAYEKGTTSKEISVESLVNEIKQKLEPMLTKNVFIQREA